MTRKMPAIQEKSLTPIRLSQSMLGRGEGGRGGGELAGGGPAGVAGGFFNGGGGGELGRISGIGGGSTKIGELTGGGTSAGEGGARDAPGTACEIGPGGFAACGNGSAQTWAADDEEAT